MYGCLEMHGFCRRCTTLHFRVNKETSSYFMTVSVSQIAMDKPWPFFFSLLQFSEDFEHLLIHSSAFLAFHSCCGLDFN